MIFTPEANQGPLLRIFITGPLGFMGAESGASSMPFGEDRRLMSQVRKANGVSSFSKFQSSTPNTEASLEGA